jgi:MFS transporter, DHA1 family, multidrug resistance protein
MPDKVEVESPGASAIVIGLLIAISALNPLSVNIIVPALTGMAEGLGTDFATAQLTLSSYLFATAIALLVHGPLSDKFGRRPIVLIGIVVYVLASIVCVVATSIWIVILGRVLQGVGAAAGFALGRAIVRDLYDREKAASMLGYITMGFSTVPMVTPLVGGLISDHFGWRLIFVFIATVSFILLVLVWLWLPETRKPMAAGEVRPGFFQSFRILARIPAFWAYTLNLGFMVAVFFIFLGGTPFVATTLMGMSGTEFGIYFAFVPMGFFVGNWVTARLATRLGIGMMIRGGNFLAMVAGIISAFLLGSGWLHPFALFAPMYLMGFANGLTMANATAGAVSIRPALAGAASGIAGSFQMGCGALATVIIGYLMTATQSALPLSILIAVLGGLALVTGFWIKTARS